MKPVNLLKYGDVIGIISPSWVANQNDYEKYAKGIERLGFRVKFGRNIYKDTYRYTASTEERADDLNGMIYDDNIKMVFFGGCDDFGHGSNHAIFPVGGGAVLDTKKKKLFFQQNCQDRENELRYAGKCDKMK